MLNKKIITIPMSGDVDITNVLPIVESSFFQRLRRISHLGPVSFIFPGATHSRFEHSLGVYQKQKYLSRRWENEGIINKETQKALEVFALLHDIGHPPFSHVTEYILDETHDENGLKIIQFLRESIEKCGVSYEFVKSFFNQTNPLYLSVMDKNLGTDKLDYLDRDAYHTNFGGRPEVNRLFSYIYWHNNQLVLDIKSTEEAKNFQMFYMMMYKQVYLRKATLIAQRLLQKAIAELLNSGMRQECVWQMDDYELQTALRISKNPFVSDILYLYNNRILPKVFISFHSENIYKKNIVSHKSIKVFGVKEEELLKIVEDKTPEQLAELERKISKVIGVSPSRVLIVPSQGGFRFVPKDINLIDGNTIYSMNEYFPEYFSLLKERSRDYLSLRVCAVGNREEFTKYAEEIKELILS